MSKAANNNDNMFFSDRTLKFIALFMIALVATFSVPHFSLWNISFGTKAASAQTTECGTDSTSFCASAGAGCGLGYQQDVSRTCSAISDICCVVTGTGGTPSSTTVSGSGAGVTTTYSANFLGTQPSPLVQNQQGLLKFSLSPSNVQATVRITTTAPSSTVSSGSITCTGVCDVPINAAEVGTYSFVVTIDFPDQQLSGVFTFTVVSAGSTTGGTTCGPGGNGIQLCYNNQNRAYYCSSGPTCTSSATDTPQDCMPDLNSCKNLCSQYAVAFSQSCQTPGTGTGTTGTTGIVSGGACNSCVAGGQFCVRQNQYAYGYGYGYSTYAINPNLYTTSCALTQQQKDLCVNQGGELHSTCDNLNLCENSCSYLAYGGGFTVSAGTIGGTSIQNIGYPIPSCSPQPPISINGIILTGTTNANVMQQPRLIQGNLCPNQGELCWCSIISASSLGLASSTTNLGGGITSIPGTTATQNWAPPKFTPPHAPSNQPACDLAGNVTLTANLVGSSGNALKLVLAGQPVTIQGNIGTKSGMCQGYSYNCLDFQQSQCTVSRGSFKDTYSYQPCPAGTERIAGKGAGSDWHFGRILGFIAGIALTFLGIPGMQGFLGLSDHAFTTLRASLAAAMVFAPTLDGCGLNLLALAPLVNSLSEETPGSPPVVGTNTCVDSTGTMIQICAAAKAAGNLNAEDIQKSNEIQQQLEQRITGRQITLPGCDSKDPDKRKECVQLLGTIAATMNSLNTGTCTQKEPRECWSVCGRQYETDVGAAPLCDEGGVPCDYDKSTKSCTQNSAVAGLYQCSSSSCGGAANTVVNIRIIAPDGTLIKQDQTRTDANGDFSYTLVAPEVNGEVTVIVSTPLLGTTTTG